MALLMGMVLGGRPDLTYDEPDYVGTVRLLDRLGFTAGFVREYPFPAGPLISVVHWLGRPFTGLEAPGVRVFQVLLLLAAIALLALAARGLDFQRPCATAASILAVPMVFTVSGMALTEIPAVVFCAGGLAALASLRTPAVTASTMARAAAAGLMLGVAALGRQPLVIAVALAPLLLAPNGWKWQHVGAFVAVGLLLPATLFVLWGGLVPPKVALFDGFVLRHGLLALAYGCIALFLLRPSMLFIGVMPALFLLALSLGGIAVLGSTEFVPFRATITRHLPSVVPLLGRLVGGGALFAALLFTFAMGKEAWRVRKDGTRLYLATTGLALVAANVKVAYFSSRYIVPAVPFLLLVGQEEEHSYWRSARLAGGAAIGALSLANYLYP